MSNQVVILFPKFNNLQMDHKPTLPLAALALAGPLQKEGFDVKILDEHGEGDLIGPLSRLNSPPVCFGISCMFSYQLMSGLCAARWIRTHFPEVPIVWGGWFPSLLSEVTLADPHVDIVIRGKGETTFTELVRALSNKTPLDGIQGITYKDGDKIVRNPDRPLEDPNTFPPKPYGLLNLQRYSVTDGTVTFNSSYGCPFRCKFCGITRALNRKWNKGLTPERTLNDLEDLMHNHKIKIKHLVFQEDNFFNNRDRAKKIIEGFLQRGWDFTWEANLRIDQMLRFDTETLRLIKRSRCIKLGAGAESAVQPMLDFLGKDLKVEQIEKGVELARDYEIPLSLNFIAGLPGETETGFVETLKNIKQLYKIYPKLNIRIYQYFPVPGTPLYEMEREQGLIDEPQSFAEWADIATNPLVITPLSPRHKLYKNVSSIYKIMTFYFIYGYQEERFADGNRTMIRRALLNILHRVSVFRFEKNFWYFPLEWEFARFLKKRRGWSFTGR